MQQELLLFADELFSQPSIEEALLSLEKKYGLNPHLILFFCWIAKRGYETLSPEEISILLNKITPWDEKLVKNIKNLQITVPKNDLTNSTQELLKTVNKAYQISLQIEYKMLVEFMTELSQSSSTDARAIALQNIFTTIKYLKIDIHKTDLEKIYTIVTAGLK